MPIKLFIVSLVTLVSTSTAFAHGFSATGWEEITSDSEDKDKSPPFILRDHNLCVTGYEPMFSKTVYVGATTSSEPEIAEHTPENSKVVCEIWKSSVHEVSSRISISVYRPYAFDSKDLSYSAEQGFLVDYFAYEPTDIGNSYSLMMHEGALPKNSSEISSDQYRNLISKGRTYDFKVYGQANQTLYLYNRLDFTIPTSTERKYTHFQLLPHRYNVTTSGIDDLCEWGFEQALIRKKEKTRSSADFDLAFSLQTIRNDLTKSLNKKVRTKSAGGNEKFVVDQALYWADQYLDDLIENDVLCKDCLKAQTYKEIRKLRDRAWYQKRLSNGCSLEADPKKPDMVIEYRPDDSEFQDSNKDHQGFWETVKAIGQTMNGAFRCEIWFDKSSAEDRNHRVVYYAPNTKSGEMEQVHEEQIVEPWMKADSQLFTLGELMLQSIRGYSLPTSEESGKISKSVKYFNSLFYPVGALLGKYGRFPIVWSSPQGRVLGRYLDEVCMVHAPKKRGE